MHLNPYGAEPIKLIVSLATEFPRTVTDLVERCLDHELVVDRPVRRRDLDQVEVFLEAWLQVVDTAEAGPRAAALNSLLARYSGHPRLTDHADGWHLHYRADDVSFADMLATLFSVGTALHLTSRGMDRLGRCAADDCNGVFADTSRGGRQRFCSTRCNNRDAVRRHRLHLATA